MRQEEGFFIRLSIEFKISHTQVPLKSSAYRADPF